MGPGTHLTLDELLGQSDWLARLAVHLAGPADADDAVQDTWLAARLSPPDGQRSPRPWLAAVLRNQVRARWQRDVRRRRREQAAAALAATEEAAADAVHERLELQRAVAERVMALDKPLRTVVLLRYFEGRDSAQIAALLNIPAGTVRWRLKTALDRLRAEMDDRFRQERRPWALVFLPAGAKAAIAVAAAGLALSLAGPLVARRPAPALTPGLGIVEGRIVDPDGPVAGAFVVGSRRGTDRPSIRWTRSDRQGRFRLPALAAGPWLLTAVGPEHGVAAARPMSIRDGARRVDLALARAPAGLAGRILDAGAGPIARARIRATAAGPEAPVFETQSACLGRYHLEVPPGAYTVEIEADGYAPVRFSAVLARATVRDFSLQPGARAAGRVLAGGSPAPGAALVARSEHESYLADADADGSFVFSWLAPGTYDIEARWGALHGERRAVVVAEAARLDGLDLNVTDR
jgi:RNA polymerase sigma-70 factor (ECF subfamily)